MFMGNITAQFFAIRSTNLSTQQVAVGQARFALEDALAIVETANNTEDAWIYEIVICPE
jgi:hypothetical protein